MGRLTSQASTKETYFIDNKTRTNCTPKINHFKPDDKLVVENVDHETGDGPTAVACLAQGLIRVILSTYVKLQATNRPIQLTASELSPETKCLYCCY